MFGQDSLWLVSIDLAKRSLYLSMKLLKCRAFDDGGRGHCSQKNIFIKSFVLDLKFAQFPGVIASQLCCGFLFTQFTLFFIRTSKFKFRLTVLNFFRKSEAGFLYLFLIQ